LIVCTTLPSASGAELTWMAAELDSRTKTSDQGGQGRLDPVAAQDARDGGWAS
jgi:hypothetical protein